jgi:hypothetical protein
VNYDAVTDTQKFLPSQRFALGQYNVNWTCAPTGSNSVAKSATHIPIVESMPSESRVDRQASELQWTMTGACVSIRRILPAAIARVL